MYELITVLFSLLEFLSDSAVDLRFRKFQCQVIKLRFHGIQSEAMGQWRIQVGRFRSNFELLFPRKRTQGPHVMQPVGKLDKNYTNVVRQCKKHFPEILSLERTLLVKNPRDFSQPINDFFHFRTKKT